MVIFEKYLTKNPCYVSNLTLPDDRYSAFQKNGPRGLMLHAVGCAQPSAEVFYNKWNRADYNRACVHAFIDANTGDIWQTLPWNFRGWHCGGSANNTHCGIEMCESKWIRYTEGARFAVINLEKAQADCRRTYNAAVELFAFLCKTWKLDPMSDICSHKEGGKQGIASGHVDPEHYWFGLGMTYTMNGFRVDVKQKMEDILDMTEQELKNLVTQVIEEKIGTAMNRLTAAYGEELTAAVLQLSKTVEQKTDSILNKRFGGLVHEVGDIKYENVREVIQRLLDADAVDGGTDREENDKDINFLWEDVRVMTVCARYAEYLAKEVEKKILFTSN